MTNLATLSFVLWFSTFATAFIPHHHHQTSFKPLTSSPTTTTTRNPLSFDRRSVWTLASSSSFSEKPNPQSTEQSSSSSSPNLTLENSKSYVKGYIRKVSEGDFGERGELYVVCQITTLLFLLLGNIPLLGGAIQFAFGPGLVLAGAMTMFAAINDIGSSLNANAAPVPANEGGGLKTSGIYGEVRHPMYAGLFLLAVGAGIWSDSAMRVVLAAVLFVTTEMKVESEERMLMETFGGEYETYKLDVPNRYLPEVVTEPIGEAFEAVKSFLSSGGKRD